MPKLDPVTFNQRMEMRYSLLQEIYQKHEEGSFMIVVDFSKVRGSKFVDYLYLIDEGHLVLLSESSTQYIVRISGKGIKFAENND